MHGVPGTVLWRLIKGVDFVTLFAPFKFPNDAFSGVAFFWRHKKSRSRRLVVHLWLRFRNFVLLWKFTGGIP
jgi:hypothetical protein